MRFFYHAILIVLVLLGFFGFYSFTGYDSLSLDSGGREDVAVSPSPVSEGSISGDFPETDEVSVTVSGGGGAGGGSSVFTPDVNVSPTEFNVEIAVNTNIQRTIEVTNLKSTAANFSVRQSNLDGLVLLRESSIFLNPKETKSIGVVVVALNETGIFTGKIIIGNKEIPVSINIRTKLLLFDSNIIVLNDDYIVRRGEDLKTQVTLIPLGDDTRLDVTLNYVIKDYQGEIYTTKSETLLVDKKIDFKRDFDVGLLKPGDYIVGLELVYPNGIATSSAHFKVVEGFEFPFSTLIYYIVVAILINVILIVVVLINRAYKEKEEYSGNF